MEEIYLWYNITEKTTLGKVSLKYNVPYLVFSLTFLCSAENNRNSLIIKWSLRFWAVWLIVGCPSNVRVQFLQVVYFVLRCETLRTPRITFGQNSRYLLNVGRSNIKLSNLELKGFRFARDMLLKTSLSNVCRRAYYLRVRR